MISEREVETSPVSKLASQELKTLFLHSSHYLAGLVANLVVGLVSFPIFTRLLSVAEYGLLDLSERVILMVTVGSKAGLQNAVLRFYDKDLFAGDGSAERKYYSTMLLGTTLSTAGMLVLFLSVSIFAPDSLMIGSLRGLVYLISALVVLRALGSILRAFLRIEERTKAFNFTTVASRVVAVAFICALMPLTGRSARTYLGGTIAGEGILVAVLIFWLFRRRVLHAGSFDPALFRAGVMYGMPLVVYEFAFAILGSADRFLVRHYLGPNALGFYSVAFSLAQSANDLLVSPLGLAILPIYMRIWSSHGAEKTTEFLSIALDLYIMCAAGVLAMTAASSHAVVVLLASTKYSGVDHLIPVLLAALMIYATYIFIAAGLLIHKRTFQMAGVLALGAVANIGFNCLLLPRIGLDGSALATLLSYALCVGLLGIASNRLMALRCDVGRVAKYLTAALVSFAAASRLTFGSPLFDLIGRSALTLALYYLGLYLLDDRVRRATRWVLIQCNSRIGRVPQTP